VTPGGTQFDGGTVLTLRSNVGAGTIFLGWTVNGQPVGWADPLTITINQDLAVVAMFMPKQGFNDIAGYPYTQAIYELSARNIIRGYGDGRFGPDDPVLRAQIRSNMDTFGLAPEAVARAIAFAIEQPHDVEIGDLTIRPTVQG